MRKELRGLAPLFLLMVLTNSGDVFYRPFVERLDEQAWTDISSYLLPEGVGLFALVELVFSLLVAFSLFPREHDEGTIDLLYGLPVARWKIFAAKVLSGWIVLSGGCLTLMCSDGLLQSFNDQSFTGEQWRLDVALTVAALQSVVCTVVLCHGVLISFFRRFGLIPYALAGWVAFSLERASPSFAWLNFTNLLSLDYEGRQVVVPWGEIAVHLAVAGVCLVGGYVLWMGQGERVAVAWSRLRARAAGRVALGCGTAAVVLGFFVLTILAFVDSAELDGVPGQGPRYRTYEVARARTERFDFTYPENARARALVVIRSADSHHEALRRRLGAEAGDRISVDLTEDSPFHEGITAWTTVRLGLFATDDARRLERTFVHELAHAFQFQLSRRRLGDNARAARFFAEGSAEWLSWEIVPGVEGRRASRRTALATWQRHRLRFEDLADDDRLRARFDTALVYSMGETWTAALVEACGERAIGDVLRAMGRDGAPRDLEPVRFWQDTLQAAGCGLEQVLSAWSRRMERDVAEEAVFLQALPRLGGGPVGLDGGELRVVAVVDRPPLPAAEFPHVEYLARVRDSPAVDDSAIRTFRGRVLDGSAGRRVEFRVPRAVLRGRRFQLQLGLRFHETSWPWFELWQDADVP